MSGPAHGEPWVALTLLAALCFAIGSTLQKHAIAGRLPPLAVSSLARALPRAVHALLRSPLWLLGLAITLAAFGLETQALARADVSVVKPLSRVQSLFAIGLGVGLLRERLSRSEWLGVGVLAAGAWVLGLEAGDAQAYAPGVGTSFATALAFVALAATGLALSLAVGRRSGSELGPALAAGALFGLGDVMMKSATEVVRAAAGGFDLASAGTLASLGATLELPLSLAATTLAFGLQQFAYARGRVSLVVPLTGVAATGTAVLLGAVLLHESIGSSRAVGIATLLAGTLLVARGEARRAPPAATAGRRAG
jgi:drug/metabolite transporter (DMT)-like permease